MKKFLVVFILMVSMDLQAQSKAPIKKVTTTVVPTLNPNEIYLTAAGLKSNDLWNAAFVYWCFNYFPGGNPLRKTGSGFEIWNSLSAEYKLTADEANKQPERIVPGNIFFISESQKEVRVGIVIAVNNDEIETVEADTYVILTRKIYSENVISKKRKLNEINLGFSNFTDELNPSTRKSAAK